MENKLVEAFVKQVSELIPDDAEKDKLFEALRKYQGSSDVPFLVQDLKRVLNDPTKLEIYDYVRPLIRPAHQQQYDKLTPNAPGTKLRVIKLRRRNNESFGFAVRGGKEHGVGIFVSNVQRGSQADLRGLKLGDEIVRVNGFTIVEAIHEEVLNLIKGKDEIELKVTNLGMVPIKQKPTDPVSWQYVEKESLVKKNSVPSSGYEGPGEVVKIFINLRGASSLGCSIVSGPKQFPGIFIERVGPGSLGAEYGLEVGDQILEVNNRSFLNIRHNEAIVELKGSKELNIVLKKKAALPLLNAKNMVNPQDSPTAERNEDSVSRSTVDRYDLGGEIVTGTPQQEGFTLDSSENVLTEAEIKQDEFGGVWGKGNENDEMGGFGFEDMHLPDDYLNFDESESHAVDEDIFAFGKNENSDEKIPPVGGLGKSKAGKKKGKKSPRVKFADLDIDQEGEESEMVTVVFDEEMY